VTIADPALAIVSLLPAATFEQLLNQVTLVQIWAVTQSEHHLVCLLLHSGFCLCFVEVQYGPVHMRLSIQHRFCQRGMALKKALQVSHNLLVVFS